MRIVEIFGAPGVGKSTLFAELRACRRRNANWLTDKEVLCRLRPGPGQDGHTFKWLANRLAGRSQGRLMTFARSAFVLEYPGLVKLCWAMINEHRGHAFYPVDTRMAAATYFWTCFARMGSILGMKDEKLALVDEGLLQRLVSLWSPAMSEKHVDTYLSAIPKPVGAILVVMDADAAVERVRGRPRVAGNHLGMDDERLLEFTRNAVAFSKTIGDMLEKNGVAVCRVEARVDIRSNLAGISKFLDGLR